MNLSSSSLDWSLMTTSADVTGALDGIELEGADEIGFLFDLDRVEADPAKLLETVIGGVNGAAAHEGDGDVGDMTAGDGGDVSSQPTDVGVAGIVNTAGVTAAGVP